MENKKRDVDKLVRNEGTEMALLEHVILDVTLINIRNSASVSRFLEIKYSDHIKPGNLKVELYLKLLQDSIDTAITKGIENNNKSNQP